MAILLVIGIMDLRAMAVVVGAGLFLIARAAGLG
jgi:hypothetical protein